MTCILVAGGAGFLGTNLCERLIRDGYEVICLDNYSSGMARNLDGLESHPNFRARGWDILEPLPPKMFSEVQQIYNLATPASPKAYQRDPIRTWKVAALGALNLLELATSLGIPILQTSTSEVYGDPLVHPQPETYWGNVNPIGPRACYDEGKRSAEALCFDFQRTLGTQIRVARLFNAYGPWMHARDGRVMSTFISKALAGEPIPIHGDGSQTRSFCYVGDIVEGLVALMESGEAGPVNLGNPWEITMWDLADKILRVTKSDSPIVHLPMPTDDPGRRCPDISRARDLLGWQPKISLEEGILRTVEFLEAVG